MSRLRDLDDRILGDPQRREEWGRKHGWALFLALGVVVLAVCAWAVSADRPAIAGMNVGLGAGFVAAGVYLFVKRDR